MGVSLRSDLCMVRYREAGVGFRFSRMSKIFNEFNQTGLSLLNLAVGMFFA